MLKRNSNFTLIELIVVIVVLGILAAIVVPNISSFAKQAREAQYTADLRNIQTGFDMESAKSADLESNLVGDAAFTTQFALDEEGAIQEATKTVTAEDGTETEEAVTTAFKLVKTGELVPEQLRKLPKYVVSTDGTSLDAFAKIDNKKQYVVVGVQVDEVGKSKAVLNYIGLETAVEAGVDQVGLDTAKAHIVR